MNRPAGPTIQNTPATKAQPRSSANDGLRNEGAMEARADQDRAAGMITSHATHATNGDRHVGLTIAAAKLLADRANSAKHRRHCRRWRFGFFHTKARSKA